MKPVLLLFLVLFCLHAKGLSLQWDEVEDSGTDVAGYVVLIGTTSGVYTLEEDEAFQTKAIPYGLAVGGTYYAVVCSYTSDETLSPPSEEVQFVVTCKNCVSMSIASSGSDSKLDAICNLSQCRIWGSQDGGATWVLLDNVTSNYGETIYYDPRNLARIYRLTN